MKKFEYKVIGQSTIDSINQNLASENSAHKPWGFLQVFNYFGEQGWELCGLYSTNNFLMKKESENNGENVMVQSGVTATKTFTTS